jgi:hypothetical protein
MEKLFLLLFLGFTLVGFSQQTTLIPDPNFEQALIDLGYDTAPINGSVPTTNISGVTYLDVSDKNISYLTGIEDFTALNYLYCLDNQLTSLDVTNNTVLTSLDCRFNQLTSIDISQNTALTYLVCPDNQLTNIDVSNNTALSGLRCSNNQLTSLDVSNNTALTLLMCFNNQLSSLELNNNLELEYLACGINQLTSLDLSNNSALLVFLCENNQLSSLDVRNGNNTNVDDMGSTNNPNLTCIYVDDADYMNANWADFIDPASTFLENEAECEALSIGDNTLELDVFIYPNPTDDYLFIEGNKNPISISIYNLLGAEAIATSATDKINVSELSKGVYIIRISDGVNQTDKKFIKN